MTNSRDLLSDEWRQLVVGGLSAAPDNPQLKARQRQDLSTIRLIKRHCDPY